MDYAHRDEASNFHKLAIGVVCGYGDSDHPMTLQVKLPFLEGKHNILDHVAFLLPYGGKEYGSYQRPELDEQVLLLFYGFNKAIAIGSLPPIGCTLTQELDDKNYKKIWKSKGGASFILQDEKDKLQLSLKSKLFDLQLQDEQKNFMIQDKDKKNKMVWNQGDGKIEMMAEKELCFRCGDTSIIMKKDGSCEIKAKKMTLSSSNSIQINGSNAVKLSSQQVELKGKVDVKIEGKSNIKLGSSGILELQGNLIKIG